MKQIICMKWGDLYSADYVNHLYNMVARYTTPPFRFCCLTNEPEGINPSVEIRPCPWVAIPEPMCHRAWRKVSLWDHQVADLEGEWLYLDLDLIITGNMDEFFTHKSDSDYVVMRNYTTPKRRIGNTSVFRFTIGSHPYILERLLADPLSIRAQYRNSQTFISNTIGNMEFWPEGWIKHFKTHCIHPWPLRFFTQPRKPEEAHIVVCTGHPMPHELVAGTWEAPWYKKIYKTLPPVKWVEDAWR